MIDVLASMPTWIGIVISILIASLTGLAVYYLSYRLISPHLTENLKDGVSDLFRVLGTLVGLMLSLSFSDVLIEYRAVADAVEREVMTISDLHADLHRFDGPATREARANLVAYTESIIRDEWPSLADDQLSDVAGALKTKLVDSVLELEPANRQQEQVLTRISAGIDVLSDYRLTRLDSALAGPPVFISLIFVGLLITMALFGKYSPQRSLLGLVSLYTSFVGLVLYLMLAMSDPFQGGLGVETDTLERLLEHMRGVG